jgi:hypothetical protein
MGLLDRNGDFVLNNGRVRSYHGPTGGSKTGIIRWFKQERHWYFLADDGSILSLPAFMAEDKKYGIEKIGDDEVKREYKHPFVIRLFR